MLWLTRNLKFDQVVLAQFQDYKCTEDQAMDLIKKAREHFHKKATETAPIINADDEGRVE